MACPVFISYARAAGTAHPRSLAARLGDLAFLDTDAIDDGAEFPQRLLDGVLDARVVVFFASAAYIASRFCRLEMRLALAGGPDRTGHLVLALDAGSNALLDAMPASVADKNWPAAAHTASLEALVRAALVGNRDSIRAGLPTPDAHQLAAAFLNEIAMPDPQSLAGIVCALPPTAAGRSIGSRLVGRAGDLRAIHRVLAEGSGRAAKVAALLAAGGGFGKSRLAAEYVHRYGPRYYPGGIFWVDAGTGAIEAAFWRVLSALNPRVPDLATLRAHGRDVRRELERALRRLPQPALYVIDNIPEARLKEDPPSIADFCPAVGAVTVLATSRQNPHEEGVVSIPVGTLPPGAAILLLTDGVPPGTAAAWSEWERIAEWVGHLPLALDLLNRCLALHSISPNELLQRVDEPSPAATKHLDGLREDLEGQVPKGAVRGITEAFSISFRQLPHAPSALALLLAQLAPAPVPLAFIEALPEELRRARAALHARHFVTGGDGLSFGVMHRLMADFLRSIAGESGPDSMRLACAVLRNLMTPERCADPKEWPLMELCRPHAETLFARGLAAGESPELFGDIGLAAAFLASEQGDHARALRLRNQVRDFRTRVLGEEHPATLTAMANLAVTLLAQGDRAGARQLEERVLEVRTRDLGPDHPDTLAAMANLAVTLFAQGDRAAALRLGEQVLERMTRVLGTEHAGTLTAVNNLAAMLLAHGDPAAAHRLLTRVLEVQARVLGAEHRSTLTTMSNLGDALRTQADYSAALALQERVVEAMTRVLGPEHPDTLAAITNLAGTFLEKGDLAAARERQQRVLEATTRTLGEEHPATLTAINNLAVTLKSQGDYAAARGMLQNAVEISARVAGEEHPDTLTAANNLALVLLAEGDHAGARAIQERAVESMTRALGLEHPLTLMAVENLASTLHAQGGYAAARAHQERVLEARRRLIGQEHPDTFTSASNLAVTLRAQGELRDAARLQVSVLDGLVRVLGEEHPDALKAADSLAVTVRALGNLAAARQLQERALEIRARVLGEEHPATLTSRTNLGETLRTLGDYAAARPVLERAVEASARLLGERHPETLTAMNNLALVLRGLGDHRAAWRIQQSVLAVATEVLGPEHPHTLAAMENLAMSLQELGDLPGARELQEQVLDLKTRVLGPGHPDTVTAMENLAGTLLLQNDAAGAAQLQEQVLAARIRLFGERHPDTLSAMGNLAVSRFTAGRIDAAIELLRKSLAGQRVLLGENHAETLATAAFLQHLEKLSRGGGAGGGVPG